MLTLVVASLFVLSFAFTGFAKAATHGPSTDVTQGGGYGGHGQGGEHGNGQGNGNGHGQGEQGDNGHGHNGNGNGNGHAAVNTSNGGNTVTPHVPGFVAGLVTAILGFLHIG